MVVCNTTLFFFLSILSFFIFWPSKVLREKVCRPPHPSLLKTFSYSKCLQLD
jgi:hypothetical protein